MDDIVKSKEDENKSEADIKKILTDSECNMSSLCKGYDELPKLPDDRFCKTFIESGSQFILQLSIFLQYCIEINNPMVVTRKGNRRRTYCEYIHN